MKIIKMLALITLHSMMLPGGICSKGAAKEPAKSVVKMTAPPLQITVSPKNVAAIEAEKTAVSMPANVPVEYFDGLASRTHTSPSPDMIIKVTPATPRDLWVDPPISTAPQIVYQSRWHLDAMSGSVARGKK